MSITDYQVQELAVAMHIVAEAIDRQTKAQLRLAAFSLENKSNFESNFMPTYNITHVEELEQTLFPLQEHKT